jgi:putative ABC transport system permease protein
MSHEPPRIPERLLSWSLRDREYREEILGDLQEEYASKSDTLGRRVWYTFEALRLAVRFSVRRRVNTQNQVKEQTTMSNLRADVKYALRTILNQPGFSLVVALALALGLGINATVFGMMDSILLRPFPFPEYERLVILSEKVRGGSERDAVSAANFLDWRKQSKATEQHAAWEGWDAALTGGEETERLQGARVTPGFFELLGVRPVIGRAFIAEEELPGHERRIVIGDGFWKRRFGANPQIVGTEILIGGEAHRIIGIAPPGFDFPGGTQIWSPLAFTPYRASERARRSLTVAAKLAPGRTVSGAQAEADVISQRLAQEYPDTNRERVVSVETLSAAFRPGIAGPLFWILLASSGVVLLVACMNIGGLLLARGVDRRHELALRTALGANRMRIVRQLVTETVVLGLVSSVFALLLARAGLDVLRAGMPADLASQTAGWNNLRLDSRVIFFIPALSILVGILMGLMPALGAGRHELWNVLKEGGRSNVGGQKRQRARQTLVVAEIACALALLIAAGLTVSSGIGLLNQPGGFDARRLLTLRIPLPENQYQEPESRREFASELLSRLEALPGVEGAAVANVLPAGGSNPLEKLLIEDHPVTDPAKTPRVGYRSVSSGFFETMKIPILRGRPFASSDREQTQPVAIVSAAMAERFWPGRDPIGRRLRIPGVGEQWLTIVGVAGDVSMYNWWAGIDFSAIYVPLRQAPPAAGIQAVIRAQGDPLLLGGPVRAAVRSINPLVAVHKVLTMRQAIEQCQSGLSIVAWLLGLCGAVAGVLSVVGIYSMMSYAMSQRRHEFGVRMALGASSGDVLRLTLGQAVKLTGTGVIAGVLLAIALGRMMAGVLGVLSLDAQVFLIVALSLAVVGLVAAYVPARKALKVDPVAVLRAD